MKPEQRVKTPKKMFSFQAEHVLQIDRKNKSLSKKKSEVEKEKDKVRKHLEREKEGIKMNKMKEMENQQQHLETPVKKNTNKKCKSKQK